MREIKFRAWDRPTNKMIYAEEYWIGKTGWSAVNRINGIAFTETDHLNGYLMQYTGLKDKEGREIYEGDIIAHPEFYETPEMSHNPKKYVVVKFKDCAFRIYDVILSDEEKDNNDYFYVAGNIYENPELLTK